MTRIYIKTIPLKLRLTAQQVRFLKTVAPQRGINYSELARRILSDAMDQWIEKQLYIPDTAEGQEQTKSSSTSIDLLPGDDGGVHILFPERLSPAVQRDVQEALKRHVPELKGLLAPNKKGAKTGNKVTAKKGPGG